MQNALGSGEATRQNRLHRVSCLCIELIEAFTLLRTCDGLGAGAELIKTMHMKEECCRPSCGLGESFLSLNRQHGFVRNFIPNLVSSFSLHLLRVSC